MMLNEVRLKGFWISGSLVVSSIISSCVKCKKLRGAVQEQRMSDLPEDRLETAPPFTYCTVDYFYLARVSAVYPSEDGQIRNVQVALADSCLDSKGKRTGQSRYFDRPIRKLVLLMQVKN